MSEEATPGDALGPCEFLTVAEVGELLRCHPRTVLNRIRTGSIQAVRLEGTRRWLIPLGEYYRFKAKLLEGAWE